MTADRTAYNREQKRRRRATQQPVDNRTDADKCADIIADKCADIVRETVRAEIAKVLVDAADRTGTTSPFKGGRVVVPDADMSASASAPMSAVLSASAPLDNYWPDDDERARVQAANALARERLFNRE